MTVATWVCWSMTSETQTRYGVGSCCQGSCLRPWASNQGRSLGARVVASGAIAERGLGEPDGSRGCARAVREPPLRGFGVSSGVWGFVGRVMRCRPQPGPLAQWGEGTVFEAASERAGNLTPGPSPCEERGENRVGPRRSGLGLREARSSQLIARSSRGSLRVGT